MNTSGSLTEQVYSAPFTITALLLDWTSTNTNDTTAIPLQTQ